MGDGRRSRILIVDDAPLHVEALVAALEECHELFFALSGPEGLRLASLHQPDLILLDILMPGMDGFEACRRLRGTLALTDVPVIFITALEGEEEEMRGLELGAVDYIQKPVNPFLVRMRVDNQLELKRQRDALKQRTLELEAALFRIKRLEGIIPICCHCKRIRNDLDAWVHIESYLREHSEAELSQGLCPSCEEAAAAHPARDEGKPP